MPSCIRLLKCVQTTYECVDEIYSCGCCCIFSWTNERREEAKKKNPNIHDHECHSCVCVPTVDMACHTDTRRSNTSVVVLTQMCGAISLHNIFLLLLRIRTCLLRRWERLMTQKKLYGCVCVCDGSVWAPHLRISRTQHVFDCVRAQPVPMSIYYGRWWKPKNKLIVKYYAYAYA